MVGSGIGIWAERRLWAVFEFRFGVDALGSALEGAREVLFGEVRWLKCCLGMVCWMIIRTVRLTSTNRGKYLCDLRRVLSLFLWPNNFANFDRFF
jgi:hypothetical protein